MTTDDVIFEVINNIAIITLNRPAKLNALNENVWKLLRLYINKCKEDNKIKVIVLTGKGRAFSAGDDINMMFKISNVDDARDLVNNIIKPTIEAILRCDKPIIAAVNGLAFGGGFELLLLVDVVVSGKHVKYCVPEIKIGLLPPLMVSIGLFTFGIKKALFLSLLGDEIDAEEAKRIGIVDYIADDPLKKAIELAKILASYPQEAIKEIKRYVNAVRGKIAYDVPIDKLVHLMLYKDARLLMKTFLEK